MVLLQPSTACIHDTEVELSVGLSLLGGLLEPAHCLGMVLLHTLTVTTRDTEVELSKGMPLLSCAPPQPKHLIHLPLLRLG